MPCRTRTSNGQKFACALALTTATNTVSAILIVVKTSTQLLVLVKRVVSCECAEKRKDVWQSTFESARKAAIYDKLSRAPHVFYGNGHDVMISREQADAQTFAGAPM